AVPLEGVRRGSRLERASAENGRATIADVSRDLIEHLLVFDGARPGDAHRVRPADFHLWHAAAADLDDAVGLMKLARRELVRLHDGNDFFDLIEGAEVF